MTELTPLDTFYDATTGDELPLPRELKRLYGPFRLPSGEGRARVFANFVTSLDGVTSLGLPRRSGGGEISGFNEHDRMVMGILRAAADAVIVGAGTLRSVPAHIWTADYIYPPLATSYSAFRRRLGQPKAPLNVIVTARGDLDPRLRVFSGEVPVLVVTTAAGEVTLHQRTWPDSVRIVAVADAGELTTSQILDALPSVRGGGRLLLEGGPHLIGDFLQAGYLDELFLTLAPQVAGRDGMTERPGLVEGIAFAPDQPVWSTLVEAKRGGSHLFLRYVFGS